MLSALITGGNKGIGKAAARALAQRGFRVWIGARDAARGEEAATELKAEGNVSFVQLDVTDRSSIKAAVQVIGAESDALDVLVNNAGISNEVTATFGVTIKPSELPEEKLRQLYDVNFFGPVAVTQAFLPLLRRSSAGRIVNVSSNLGSFALSTDEKSPVRAINTLGYRSSKAALNMATVQFAYELRDTSIKINAANPGLIATDLTGQGNGQEFAGRPGFGTPEDGARIILKLATLPDDGPSGGFFDFSLGALPW
jgi:NAD(P)-dependent dehydrogenase (short-subunit alcohol dehydrogenase family)